jgi:hypothetical protein
VAQRRNNHGNAADKAGPGKGHPGRHVEDAGRVTPDSNPPANPSASPLRCGRAALRLGLVFSTLCVMRPHRSISLLSALIVTTLGLTACGGDQGSTGSFEPIIGPTDISGLTWLGSTGDEEGAAELFLAVHDGKDEEGERDLTRVSILRSATDESGVARNELRDLEFPVRGLSNDLESVARIPGQQALLLVESGNGGDKADLLSSDADAGMYYATYDLRDGEADITLVSYTKWPTTPQPLNNVESTAVVAGDGGLWFMYAERASGSDDTIINWTTLDIAADGTLTFGDEWRSAPFTRPGPADARPASALEVGPDGAVYVASAWDPDDDGGPFESAVWLVGFWNAETALLEALPEPQLVARADGFKIEAVAVAGEGDDAPIFIGVDDENYGGTLRLLRPR